MPSVIKSARCAWKDSESQENCAKVETLILWPRMFPLRAGLNGLNPCIPTAQLMGELSLLTASRALEGSFEPWSAQCLAAFYCEPACLSNFDRDSFRKPMFLGIHGPVPLAVAKGLGISRHEPQTRTASAQLEYSLKQGSGNLHAGAEA